MNYPPDFIEFKKLPTNLQEQKLKTLSLEKQVDYYEYCWSAKSCDKFYYEIIAGQGKAALPYLLNRMEKSSDSKKYEISTLLEKMDEEYVKLDDKETVGRLKGILNDMKDPVWKEMAQSNLADILRTQE